MKQQQILVTCLENNTNLHNLKLPNFYGDVMESTDYFIDIKKYIHKISNILYLGTGNTSDTSFQNILESSLHTHAY